MMHDVPGGDIVFMATYILLYYAHLASVRFEHSVSWITYDRFHPHRLLAT